MADDFAAGFLGSLLKNQEAGMAANKPNPELDLKLLQAEAEGTIQKKPGVSGSAPFANDPQGAMSYIAKMMGMGGQANPVDQYQAKPKATGAGTGVSAALISRMDQLGIDNPPLKQYLQTTEIKPSEASSLYQSFLLEQKDEDLVRDAYGNAGVRDRRTKTVTPIEIPGKAKGALSEYSPLHTRIIETAKKSYESDPIVKDIRNQISAMGNTSAMLESNNPAAVGPALSQIARSLAGEKGVLTEQDIQRVTGSRQLADRFWRFYTKNITRQGFNDTDLKDFRGLMQSINTSAQSRMSAVTENRLNRLHKSVGGDKEGLRSMFALDLAFEEAPQTRLPGQATGQPLPGNAGVTQSGAKWKVIP